MSYVQQICDGYNKKTLLGNWYEERIYPEQPFRTQQVKQARTKDQGITCYDNTGFQRQLPRLSRRNKWQTTSRIVLDDGIKQQKTVMKQQFPNNQQQHATKLISRPFDKTLQGVQSTTVHPHSQLRTNQKKYHLLDQKAIRQLQKNDNRLVQNYGSDFRSTLIQHPQIEKYTNYQTQYKGRFNQEQRGRAVSEMVSSQQQNNYQNQQVYYDNNNMNSSKYGNNNFAGNFNPIPESESTVKPITNMTGELKKQTGDHKEVTEIQRSWVPPRDKAISYSMGRTVHDFKKANIPPNDIQTSINMNIGVQNIHPKNVPDNFFRHVRQDVTVSYNNTFCSRP